MAKMNKRYKALAEKVDPENFYPLADAFALAKETSSAKFDEGIDVAINLGVDAKKSDQAVRGATVLPKGTGRTVRVAVFTDGDNVEKAKEAGADIVGMEDLAEQVKKGEINFDLVIASPDAMRVVGQLGQILGPKGLMPNPKTGTVSADVATAVSNAKAGQVQYRIDKAGIIHCTIGKASFSAEDLKTNFEALLSALHKAKPASAKGQYFKRVSVSASMGPGIRVDRQTLPQF
jgi:large subunit ribosomal protein L1